MHTFKDNYTEYLVYMPTSLWAKHSQKENENDRETYSLWLCCIPKNEC